MLITHVSIPADEPARVAVVLAGMLNGAAAPAPKGAWLVTDHHGETEIAVCPRGAHAASEMRVAICVDRPADEIVAIARAAGWPAAPAERDGGFSSLIEVWVEGNVVVECLDPLEIPLYRERGEYLDEQNARRVA